MTKRVTTHRVDDANSILACQRTMQRVFRDELGFRAMNFPDKFESNSAYVELRFDGELAGAFRIIKPNQLNHCPASEMWPGAHTLAPNSVCQFSRVVVLPSFRKRGIFQKAIAEAVMIAHELGVRRVISEVLKERKYAYARYGFEVIGEAFYDPTVDVRKTGKNNCIPMLFLIDKPSLSGNGQT